MVRGSARRLDGIGPDRPPFLHEARAYVSKDTVKSTSAGTVTTNRELTHAPLVVRSVDDAILAAIELHDLLAPDDGNTSRTPGPDQSKRRTRGYSAVPRVQHRRPTSGDRVPEAALRTRVRSNIRRCTPRRCHLRRRGLRRATAASRRQD